MHKKFLIFAVAVWLCACAQPPHKPIPDAINASPEPQAEDQPEQPDSASAPTSANLPKQELSENVLYEFLLGEIAGQRGQLTIAAKAYLDIAMATRDPRIAQRATEVALYARQPDTAMLAARIWSETDPDSAQARQTLVALLVSAHKLDEARPHIEKLLAAEGENIGQGFLQLNGLMAKTTDKNAALNLVRELAKPYSQLPEAHFALSQAAWNAAKYDEALSEVRKALELRPDWEPAALFQGQMLQRDSNHLAIDYLRGYLKNHLKAKDVRLSYARLLVAEKNYPEARKQFQHLVADFPKNAEVSLAVGLLSM
ncbi:MAG: tetratricopeptide repeat protein, partial [Burkholderiales bacterium]